jgi:hypothetical protein
MRPVSPYGLSLITTPDLPTPTIYLNSSVMECQRVWNAEKPITRDHSIGKVRTVGNDSYQLPGVL